MPRLLRLPDVLNMMGIQRGTVYAWVRQGKFPPPIKIGARASAWRLDEVEQWVEDRTKASRPEPVVM